MEHPHSFTSSPLTQLPIPTANQNLRSSSRQDHSEIWGLYKPAQTYLNLRIWPLLTCPTATPYQALLWIAC